MKIFKKCAFSILFGFFCSIANLFGHGTDQAYIENEEEIVVVKPMGNLEKRRYLGFN